MPKILSNEQDACNMIKSIRKSRKKSNISKTISVPLKIDDIKVSLRTMLGHNILTKSDLIKGSGIGYKTLCICPTTNQKLKCTNQHALDMLNYNRKINKERYCRKKKS